MVKSKNKKSTATPGISRVKKSLLRHAAKSSSNLKRTTTSSSGVHAKRTRSSFRSRLSERDRRIFAISRRIIVAVIVISMLAVILMLLTSIFTNPETRVTRKIESITADYYENYFYPRIEDYGTTDKSLSEILSRYTETGFSRVTLRQLLLFDSERYADSAALLTEYCDPELTYIRIYPDAPFTKSDYHVEYNYSCTF